MNKIVQVEGLQELIRQLEHSGDLREKIYFPIHDAMAQAGRLLEDQIKQNLTENDSVVTGDLRGSVSSSEVQITKEAIFIEVGAGRGLPYARAVEYGTKPHTPPLSITEPGQPLYKFVEIKRLTGLYSIKTGRRLGGNKRQVDENRQAARAIWAHIRKFGTRPHPYFMPAIEQTKERIVKLFEEAVEKIAENILKSA
jgi:hypothetical protein